MINTLTKRFAAALFAAVMIAPTLLTQSANAGERVIARSLKDLHPTVSRTVQRAMPKLAAQRGKDPTADDKDDKHDAAILQMYLTCGDNWFIFWVEDKDGNPIMGTITVHCDGEDTPVG